MRSTMNVIRQKQNFAQLVEKNHTRLLSTKDSYNFIWVRSKYNNIYVAAIKKTIATIYLLQPVVAIKFEVINLCNKKFCCNNI